MNYRNTYSWKQTLELLPLLVRLAEELPAAEEQGLKSHLLDLVVSLPTAVGLDLTASGNRRQEQMMRLEAALAALEAVYPAIDATQVGEAAQALQERLAGNEFSAEIPPPPPPAPEEDEEETPTVSPASPSVSVEVTTDQEPNV